MNDLTAYIDNYFNGLLKPEEKQVFESRCENDEAFAEEVALYIASRSAMRDELLEQKSKEWKNLDDSTKKNSTKLVSMRRWYIVAAAAAVICFVLLLIPFGESPQQMADAFIKDNLQQISVTMSGTTDSLQTGIEAYNKKEYKKAKEIFSEIYLVHPDNTDALKYEGLSNLMLEDFNNAIILFDSLAAKQNLFANPGLFYKAIGLLKRNGSGDIEQAKQLLQLVVDKQLANDKEAVRLLQKI